MEHGTRDEVLRTSASFDALRGRVKYLALRAGTQNEGLAAEFDGGDLQLRRESGHSGDADHLLV